MFTTEFHFNIILPSLFRYSSVSSLEVSYPKVCSIVHATCSTHLILLMSVALTIWDEECRLWTFLLSNSSIVLLLLWWVQIFSLLLWSQTPRTHVLPCVRDQKSYNRMKLGKTVHEKKLLLFFSCRFCEQKDVASYMNHVFCASCFGWSLYESSHLWIGCGVFRIPWNRSQTSPSYSSIRINCHRYKSFDVKWMWKDGRNSGTWHFVLDG